MSKVTLVITSASVAVSVTIAPLAYKNLFVVSREDRIVYDVDSKVLFYDANCDGVRSINSKGGEWPYTDCVPEIWIWLELFLAPQSGCL